MSTYLRRLVARSRGTLDTVHPRVPARFEAWSEPMSPIGGEAVQASPEADADRPASLRARREVADDAAPIANRRPVRGTEALPAEAHRDSAAAPAARADDPDPWENPSRQPPLSRVAPWQSQRALTSAAPAIATPVAASPQMPPRVRMLAHTGAAPQRRGMTSAMFSPATPAAMTENVVHVTIGRVDVRAVAPPAAPPQRPRPTPRGPGLEEWLAGRSRS